MDCVEEFDRAFKAFKSEAMVFREKVAVLKISYDELDGGSRAEATRTLLTDYWLREAVGEQLLREQNTGRREN